MIGKAASDAPRADAIVVLGCALHAGSPSPALVRRVARGVALFEQGVARRLVLSGGGSSCRAEAAAMRELALARGVPDDRILLEPDSRDTLENALRTAALMRAHGLASLILVTDRYHLARARFLFRRAGLSVVGCGHPPPRAPWREAPAYLREGLAFAANLLRLAWRGPVAPQ